MNTLEQLIEQVNKNYNSNYHWDLVPLAARAFITELCKIIDKMKEETKK